jgi:hypothetical protein
MCQIRHSLTSLYERHGFEIVDTIQVGSSPSIFPMVRHPRSTRRSTQQNSANSDLWIILLLATMSAKGH